MSETYKVVYRADLSDGADRGPLWEPGCPLQIVVAQVSRNVVTAELYLQLRLRNVGARLINSCKIVVILTHDDGLEEQEEIEKLDMDVLPGATCDVPPLHLGSGTVASLSVRITELTATGAAWATRMDPSPVPTKLSLELPERLLSARKRELDKIDASKTGLVLHGRVQNHVDYWICACGQANVGRTACCTCGFPKERLRGLESEDTLEQIARSFEEDEQKRAEKHAASVKQLRKVAVAAAALVVAGAAGFAIYAFYNNVIVPQQRYNEALSKIEAGNYDEGISVLEGLGSFGDAQKQIELAQERMETEKEQKRESELQAARDLISSGDYEGGIDELKRLNAKQEAWQEMYQYAANNPNHDNRLTFKYLDELSSMSRTEARQNKELYQDAVSLYNKLYSWKIRLIINNDENDWTSNSGGSIAHIQVDNAPLFPDQNEASLTVNVQSPLIQWNGWGSSSRGWSSDSTTLTFDVVNGSINGQRATVTIDPDQPARSRILVTYEREEICQVSLDD